MPWKGEKDPYRIWLSEIILQQTRVEQGLPYYQRFLTHFPNIDLLARALDTQVLKLWEGLGYYSRCRNLLATARHIANDRKGVFPQTYEEIRTLAGIGPYTAAAISSFAFNLPHAVVDGNVFRVLARVFGISAPTDSTAGKKLFTELADDLIDRDQPGIYNQAIMDFGATVCKPVAPLCGTCVLRKICIAFNENRVEGLPVKEKKLKSRKRWFYYLVPEYKDQTLIRQRTAKDIWQQLYEFPMVETTAKEEAEVILSKAEQDGWLQRGGYEVISVSPVFKQQLSHQLITGRFIRVKLDSRIKSGNLKWISRKQMDQYPFPRFINQYLDEQKRID